MGASEFPRTPSRAFEPNAQMSSGKRAYWRSGLCTQIERVTNIHQWLHGDPRRLTLQSPIAGPQMGSREDLKNEMLVRSDAWNRIKPGMTALMQAARMGNADEVRRLLKLGEDVNAAEDTSWTALMVAAVTLQPQVVSALLDGGGRVDQQDRHGDTALIAAAAVRFGELHLAAEILRSLLSHGASVEATHDLGESAADVGSPSGQRRVNRFADEGGCATIAPRPLWARRPVCRNECA